MLVFENVRFIFALFILFLLIIKEDDQPNFFVNSVALQALMHMIYISMVMVPSNRVTLSHF